MTPKEVSQQERNKSIVQAYRSPREGGGGTNEGPSEIPRSSRRYDKVLYLVNKNKK